MKRYKAYQSVISSVTKPDQSGIKAWGTVTSREIIRPQSGNQFVSERIRAYLSVGKVNKNDSALLADLKRGIRRWCELGINEKHNL